MQERFNKYFWDGGVDCCSGSFRLRRIIEYASFPDLIVYPFEEVKQYLSQIDLKHLRTSQSRIEFMQLVKDKEGMVDTWDEIFYRMTVEESAEVAGVNVEVLRSRE